MCFLWKFSWCIWQGKRGKFGRVVGGGGMDQAFTIRWNSQWRYVGRSRDTSFPIKLLCMLYCETKLAFCIFAQDGTQVQLKSVHFKSILVQSVVEAQMSQLTVILLLHGRLLRSFFFLFYRNYFCCYLVRLEFEYDIYLEIWVWLSPTNGCFVLYITLYVISTNIKAGMLLTKFICQDF